MRLDTSATFRTLIVGRSNYRAVGLARRLVGRSRDRPRLLHLQGPSGSGKSHIAHAAANEFLRRHPASRAVLLTTEEFCNSYVAAIRSGTVSEFRRQLNQGADALFIDEMEDFAGKHATQDELCITIAALVRDEKIVVLATAARSLENVGALVRKLNGVKGTLGQMSLRQRSIALRRMLTSAGVGRQGKTSDTVARRYPTLVHAKLEIRRFVELGAMLR